jgi:hypothetical protein
MGPMHPNWGERHYRQLSKLKAYELRVAALLEISNSLREQANRRPDR